MRYEKYIVSFIAGSSGRFLTYLLDRIIRNSNDEIIICENNSAHYNNTYTGISIEDPNKTNIYDTLYFDNFEDKPEHSSILATHVYPDFEVINKRFTNIGIILIKVGPDDFKEIIFNCYLKNHNNIKQISQTDIRATILYNKLFFRNNKPLPENCTVIKYKDIFTPTLYEKLTEITGIKDFPNSVYRAVDQYSSNRSRLVKEYMLR